MKCKVCGAPWERSCSYCGRIDFEEPVISPLAPRVRPPPTSVPSGPTRIYMSSGLVVNRPSVNTVISGAWSIGPR